MTSNECLSNLPKDNGIVIPGVGLAVLKRSGTLFGHFSSGLAADVGTIVNGVVKLGVVRPSTLMPKTSVTQITSGIINDKIW